MDKAEQRIPGANWPVSLLCPYLILMPPSNTSCLAELIVKI